MSLELWLLTLVPLVVFVLVELKWGVKAGAISAVALAVALAIYWYFRFNSIDETLIAEACLIAVLGIVSVKLSDGRFIKLQPVVMAAIMAAYCGYFQIFDRPVLVRWMPLMSPFAPQLEWMSTDPHALSCMGGASAWLVWVFVAHGIIVGFAALKFSSMMWLLARLMIYPLMVAPAAYLGFCLRH